MGRRKGHIQMIEHYFNFEFFERWRKFYGFSREAVSTQIGYKTSYLTWCMRNDCISKDALDKLLLFMEKVERTDPIKILRTYYSCAFVNDRVIDRNYFHEAEERKNMIDIFRKNKLKPCPFCGREAHLMDMGYPHWIYCEDCGAQVHGRKYGKDGIKASIEAWNRRTKKRRTKE